MSDLMNKMVKKTNIKGVGSLEESTFFGKDIIQTPLLAMNIALHGTLNGGLSSGITTISGESRTFKTLFGLMLMKSYLDKYSDSIAIFYDTEFGTTPEYLKTFGIDTSRVIHIPIKNIEELKFDIVSKLEDFEKKDKVFFFIDSIGNIASKKELDDALDSKSVADMTRAKQMKSLGRMITPYLSINDIPLVQIGHTYQTQDMYPQDIVSGGRAIMYTSQNVLIVKKRQIKDGREKTGNIFDIIVEKSRYVREKAKIGVKVMFNEKINKYSGLWEVAEALGFIHQPKKGFYQRIFDLVDEEDKSHRRKNVEFDHQFWEELIEKSNFARAVENYYTLGGVEIEEEVQDGE